MPLAIKDNKLLVKDGKLCTTCCGGDPPLGVCLTRPSESGSCEYWDFDGRAPFEFDTESEAAAARDAGNQQTLINPETGQPMQSQVGWIYQNTSNGKWYYDAVWLLDDGSGNAYREEDSRTTDQGFCESILVPICPAGNCDPADVQDQAEAMIDNHYVYWDAYECNVVASEEECTGIDAQFCPDLTECPSDFSEGCPETPIRSNPLP